MSLISNLWDSLTGRLHTRISEGSWRTEELAEQVRISQQQVSRLERGVAQLQAYRANASQDKRTNKAYYTRKSQDVLPVGPVVAEELKVITVLCNGSYGKPGDFRLTDSVGNQKIVDRFTFYANYELDASEGL